MRSVRFVRVSAEWTFWGKLVEYRYSKDFSLDFCPGPILLFQTCTTTTKWRRLERTLVHWSGSTPRLTGPLVCPENRLGVGGEMVLRRAAGMTAGQGDQADERGRENAVPQTAASRDLHFYTDTFTLRLIH